MRGIRFIKEREIAVKLRRRGFSIGVIEKQLGINRSTLSGWLKSVKLNKSQMRQLVLNRKEALLGAQAKAAVWHNLQKTQRLVIAEKQAALVLSWINLADSNILDLALAMLYWGEGFKKELGVGMGNADPTMLRFLIYVLKHNYQITDKSLTAQLHLRADQVEDFEITYWSNQLGIPRRNFKWTQFDKRTLGQKTFSNYHGVCTVYCHNVAIQRKLLNISKQLVEKILEKRT